MRSQRGFGYLEVLLALTVIASAVAGAGLALQSHVMGQRDSEGESIARALVADGLERARLLPRVDPQTGSSGGLEMGEPLGYADDVGDLDGRIESPPEDARGSAVGKPGEWERRFAVEAVAAREPMQLDEASALLRVRVSVARGGRVLAEGTCWRAGEP